MPSFTVYGIPVQQGSKVPGQRKNGTLFVREAAKGHKEWRQAVVNEAKYHMSLNNTEIRYPLDGPLEVWLHFAFPPLKTSDRLYKTSAPDLDKLVRNVGDALQQSGMIKDDARIVRLEASKVHAAVDSAAGVTISVMQLNTREEDNGN